MPRAIHMLDRAVDLVRFGVENDVELVYPLFAKPWNYATPEPAVLAAAWRAILEMLLDMDCEIVEDGVLRFALQNGREIEISDEWRDVWCLMIHTPTLDDMRSTCSTDSSPDCFFDL